MSTYASTPNTAADDVLDIAVGIIRDVQGRYLIAQRRPGTLGAGYWEFPGGKREPGEAMQTTLVRELQEELGVTPLQPQLLIRMRNPAAMRPVRLHVWLVTHWQGCAHGREGQHIEWCPRDALTSYQLLPGNRPLLNALILPRRLHISADSADVHADSGVFCLHAPQLGDADYAEVARRMLPRAAETDTIVLLDRSPSLVTGLGAAGLYLPGATGLQQRPVSPEYLFGVCADSAEAMRATGRLAADFAVLSLPQKPFDWVAWEALRADFGLPVYALGAATGMATAWRHNAQGIAFYSD